MPDPTAGTAGRGLVTAMRAAAYPEEDPATVPPPEAVATVLLAGWQS